MNSSYRSLVPNTITMASLACGVISLLLSASGALQPAALLIMASYILDLLDGWTARLLKANSPFGLQLDSLADIVSLGAAPGVLIFAHLRGAGAASPWVWAAALLVPLAGAFRLARYNLLPSGPTANRTTLGLTISTGGATLTLAVLSDLAVSGVHLPAWAFLLLAGCVCLLMVSRIAFPSFAGIFSKLPRAVLLALLFAASLLLTPVFTAWFLWTSVYIVFSLGAAGLRRLRQA